MERRTMAAPHAQDGNVRPVLPNFRVGNLPLLSSIDFSAGAAALRNALAQGRRAGGRQ